MALPGFVNTALARKAMQPCGAPRGQWLRQVIGFQSGSTHAGIRNTYDLGQ